MKWTALLFVSLVLGCAGVPDSTPAGGATAFPEAPYDTVDSETGALRVAVRTAPAQPPTRGLVTAELEITDASGGPRDGLDLTITPWMAEMGHGTSTEPTVEPLGEGRYRVSNLALYMPGRWELRATLAGPTRDHVVLDLDVR